MDLQHKTKEELVIEFEKLQSEYENLKRSFDVEFQDRKDVEEALRKSEDNLFITLHSIGDAVISTDKQGLVVRMNPVAEELCGWKLTEAIGKPLTEVFVIINAETRLTVSNPVKKVLELGEIVGLANHTVLISRNGKEYHISDSAAPIKNKEGEITGIVLVFSDVTEHYLAQLLIKENEERNNSLLNNLEAGIVVHSPDTSIVMNNHRASELLGLSENQLRGKEAIDPAWNFVDEDLKPLPFNEYPVNRIFNGREPIQNQIMGIHQPDKEEIVWVTVNGFPVLDHQGSIVEIVISFIDISDGKKAEKALKQREQELRRQNELFDSLIKNLPMGVFMVDVPSGKPLVANKAALRLLGRGILPGASKHNLAEVYHAYKNDRDHPYPLNEMPIVKGMNGVASYIDDMIVLRPDGCETKLEVFGSPVKDDEGKVWASLVSFSDITQRKLMEESLRESQKRLEEAHKLAHIGVWDWDSKTDTVIWSKELYSIAGLDPTKPAPSFKEQSTLYSPQSWQLLSTAVEQSMKTGDEYQLELHMFHSDGTLRNVTAYGGVKFDALGQVVGLFGTLQDTSERKQLEEVQNFLLTCGYPGSDENFFESLAKFLSRILHTEYVCIDRLEGEGLTAQTLAIYNEGKFEANVSYTLGQTPCGDVVGKTICCFPKNVCQLFPHDEALQELKAQSYIGTTLWSYDGEPIGLIAIIGQKPMKNLAFAESVLKMVSIRAAGELERLQVEAELLNAKEKAEESDRLKSAFLANMSHEIRTPMNGILGFAEILQDPSVSSEKQQEYLKIIEKSGTRMLNIINDIIDISKIESGLMKVSFSESNVNEQIEYINIFFKPEAEAKNIKLTYKTTLPTSEALLTTDREKLYAILTNLVKNAIKFTTEGSIELGYSHMNEPGFIQFYVKDTGIGIPRDRQKAIFERFIQSDISDKMAKQGAGLGLAITKSFVEMLGGRIWVESELGVGSTFNFTLPYNLERN